MQPESPARQRKYFSINLDSYRNPQANKPFFLRKYQHPHHCNYSQQPSTIQLEQENMRYNNHLKLLKCGASKHATLQSADSRVQRSLQTRQIPYLEKMTNRI